MSEIVLAVSAMSVAYLYCSWRSYHEQISLRHRQLRERVTYMLWVMANNIPEGEME
jgi:hypothetical protein